MSSLVVKEFPLEEEYKKKTGITPQDISKLREWLKTQPHLPEEYITDLDLILIYHCCDRSTEVSKQVLDLHYTLRTLFSSFFKDRLMNDKVLKTLNSVLIYPVKERSSEGYATFYLRLLDCDPKNYFFCEAIRAILMVLDLWQYEDGTWPGFILIIDMHKAVVGHLARLDLQTIQQFLYFLQEAMLVKLKSLHFLNAPPFMDKLMMMFKPFMKKALFDLLVIHQVGSRTLDKYCPMKALPKGCGGEYRTIDETRDEIIAKMEANKEFFVNENKKRVVEARRPGKPKTITDIFGGVEGSFKKLDID